MTYQILLGNNLDILPTLADNSIDSIVTDPPYELGFMGKKWDSSGIAYSVELWQQCLRVLKPGGHLLSFGGTRTWHRVAVGIEDAGFEIRDSMAWLYGSGFPKSLDVSKAIDKGQGQNRQRQLDFTAWMRSTGMTAKEANKILQEAGCITANGTMAGHYFDNTQPAIATADLFDKLRPYLPEVPEEIERLVAERTGIEWTEYKNRKVVGINKKADLKDSVYFGNLEAAKKSGRAIGYGEFDITAPSTPEAQQWQGWGTALKPAFEPIVVARKPIEGTVANNVLKHGTGGLNIDGSRIGTETIVINNYPEGFDPKSNLNGLSQAGNFYESKLSGGRWPANILLDEHTAQLLDEQSGITKDTAHDRGKGSKELGIYGKFNGGLERITGFSDKGGASRFFYVAKASKRDRNEGLDELEERSAGSYDGNSGRSGNRTAGDGVTPIETPTRQNFHPTVKPTTLMEYLIKLVTPPGGTVLDPFTGSGSTGKAAILQGFDFIGIELTKEYLPIIEGRLKHAEALVAERIKETANKQSEVLF